MKYAIMTRIVDDDFEKGNCYECPFYEWDSPEDGCCIAMYRHDECALTVEEVNE